MSIPHALLVGFAVYGAACAVSLAAVLAAMAYTAIADAQSDDLAEVVQLPEREQEPAAFVQVTGRDNYGSFRR